MNSEKIEPTPCPALQKAIEMGLIGRFDSNHIEYMNFEEGGITLTKTCPFCGNCLNDPDPQPEDFDGYYIDIDGDPERRAYRGFSGTSVVETWVDFPICNDFKDGTVLVLNHKILAIGICINIRTVTPEIPLRIWGLRWEDEAKTKCLSKSLEHYPADEKISMPQSWQDEAKFHVGKMSVVKA